MLKRIFSTLLFLALASVPAMAELSSEDQTLLSKAYGKLQDRNFDEARQLAEGATSDLVPALVEFLYLTDKTSFPTFGEAAAFLSAHPDWPSADKIALKAELGLTESLGAENLAAWFKLYPPKTARGAIFEAAALSQMGDAKALQEAIVRSWTSLSFPDEDAEKFVKDYGSLLSEADHIARLNYLLDAGLIEEAQHQSHRTSSDWQALADARLALQEGSKSAMKLVDALPASVADNGGLKSDVVAYLHRREKFNELDEYLLTLGPANGGKPEEIWPIRAKSARRLLLMGESLSAYQIAADHGLTATSGFAELEWLAGWIALEELEKPDDALAHFDRYYKGTSSAISLGKAAYWAARAAEALGDGEAARRWLELSAEHGTAFYGQLAAARLGLAPGSGLPNMPKLSKETLNNFLAGELPQAALALAGLGDRADTALFVLHLGKSAESAEAFHLAGALAERMGRTDLMVKVGKLARNKGVLLIDYLFPLPSLDGGNAPEDALVYALIRQESEFDPQAESHAGALGLMQLMPKTAKKVAKDLGLSYEKSKLTEDPLFNIQLGRAYIAELIDRFNGSYVLATAGYNAGPSRSDQWIELNGDPRNEKVDLVDWIESIPFDETRNYVMRVSEGLVVYRHLLGQTEVADWTGFNPAGQGAEGARQPACCGVN